MMKQKSIICYLKQPVSGRFNALLRDRVGQILFVSNLEWFETSRVKVNFLSNYMKDAGNFPLILFIIGAA